MSLLPLLLLPLLLLLLIVLRHGRRSNSRLPPSPGAALPVLGHLHLLIGKLPHRALRDLAARHGPVILLRLGATPVVVVSSAAAAREAFKDRGLAFAGRPSMHVPNRLFYGARDMVFAPHGEYWRQVRRVCARSFFSQSSAFRGIREEEVAALVDRVRRLAGAAGRPVDLSELLITLTNDVLCRAALGRRHSGTLVGGEKVASFFPEMVDLLGTNFAGELIPWLGWVDRLTGLEARLRRLHAAMDAFLQTVIAEHRSRNNPVEDGDLVDVLLEVQRRGSAGEDDGLSLADDDIKAIVLDMFAAGTDTSYTAMEWTMAELLRHPEEMLKAQQEVRAAGIAGELPYLQAVIKESFRLHPPLPLLVPRETTEETELLGYRVPARTRVVANCWAIGRDPGSWPDSPEEFRPARFAGSGVDYKGNDFGLIPFGAGRRICPGVAFAMPTVEAALAGLLYHFDWELPGGHAGETLDVTEAPGIDVHLKSHLVLVAKPWLP